MIQGIGNDIIAVKRMQRLIDRHGKPILDKLFTKLEQEYCLRHVESARNFSGRFTAKEAIVKAMGTGFGKGVGFLDIEVLNDPRGKPEVHLSASLKALWNNPTILLSISHCHEYATAVAICCS